MEMTQRKGFGRGTLLLLGLFFLLSGSAGLVYEVIWFRLLFLKLGGTGLSVATVTAAFMGGLGLGAWLFGTRWAQTTPPIRLYAVLEAVIGIYALAVPFLVDVMGQLDTLILGGEADSTLVRLIRYLMAGVVLLPPTICMGGTLPALARLVEQTEHRPGRFIGILYGLNTTGAVVGAGAAGFYILPTLGFNRTVLVVAAVNLGLALVAFWLSHAKAERPRMAPDASAPRTPSARARPGLAIAAYSASGAVAFMLQVTWTRILALVFATTVYAFTMILVIFLTGLGVGALIAAPLLDRIASPRRVLAWIFVITGSTGLLGQALYQWLPFFYLDAMVRTDQGLALGSAALLAMILMLPATLALGAGFPVAVRLATGDARGEASANVGRLYAGNTTGSVIGAFVTALFLIPALGLAGVVSFASLCALAMAAVLAASSGSDRAPSATREWAPAGAAAVIAVIWLVAIPGWNQNLMSESVAFWRGRITAEGEGVFDSLRDLRDGGTVDLLYYKDGVTASVAVKDEFSEGQSNRYMMVDGKVDASTIPDMLQQTLLAQLPLLVRPSEGAKVLVIGYASGVTTGSVLTHDVESVVVSEIEEVVMEASHFFDETARSPLDDPRTVVVANDARAYLERTERTFDVISSAPSSAWLPGPAKLFTRESLQLMRDKLAPDGVLAQYVQAYDLGEDAVFTLLRTVQHVFEHVAVFQTDESNLILIASAGPILFDLARLEETWRDPKIGGDLRRAGLRGPLAILEQLVAEPAAVALGIPDPGGLLNTDDNALLEYYGPQSVGQGVYPLIQAGLEQESRGPARMIAGLEPDGPVDPGRLAFVAMQQGARRTALSLARRKLEIAPDASALWVLAELLREQQKRVTALESVEEALRLQDGFPPALISRAMILQELGRPDAALASLDQAAAVLQENPLILTYRGLAELDRGNPQQAAAHFQRARQDAGGRPLPVVLEVHLARALDAAGRAEEAGPYLEAYLARVPAQRKTIETVAARQRLADLLERQGGDPERVEALRQRARVDRVEIVDAVLRTASKRLEQETPEAALHYLRFLADLDPGLRSALQAGYERRTASGEADPTLASLLGRLSRG